MDEWLMMGPEDRDVIDGIIASSRASLAAAGFPVRSRRFPFAMHHEVYKRRIPRRADRSKARHADVARLLNAWAVTRKNPADYAWQAIEGAVRCMIANDPSLAFKVPGDIKAGLLSVREGADFIDWLTGHGSALLSTSM